MQKLAKELGVVIPVSFFEEANNAHYNSVAIIDADGTDLGLYRKSHIPDGSGMLYQNYLLLDYLNSILVSVNEQLLLLFRLPRKILFQSR